MEPPHRPLSETNTKITKNYDVDGAPPPDALSSPLYPKLKSPSPNIPPTDDEKREILINARDHVLGSDDPELQLGWAQDVLSWIDVSLMYTRRLCHLKGTSVPTASRVEQQILQNALKIVDFLAEQKHPKALFLLGMRAEFGQFGYRKDIDEALRYYMLAVQRGYARADYRIGMYFEQKNDLERSIVHYNRGSSAGDSASNYRRGMSYLFGQMGQDTNLEKGIKLMLKSAPTADENAPQGAYVLGMLQARELPSLVLPERLLPYDEHAALMNIERAAYLGFAKAQLKMGSIHELGSLGCGLSPTLSLHYYRLAAKQGEPEAEMAISKWFLCGFDNLFHRDDDLAYEFAERAAKSNLPIAFFAMGYFNELGIHVPINLSKALMWYEKAASHGNQDAPGRIEAIKNTKTLTKNDHETVALTRIRSQYGSDQGQRLSRLARMEKLGRTEKAMRGDSGDGYSLRSQEIPRVISDNNSHRPSSGVLPMSEGYMEVDRDVRGARRPERLGLAADRPARRSASATPPEHRLHSDSMERMSLGTNESSKAILPRRVHPNTTNQFYRGSKEWPNSNRVMSGPCYHPNPVPRVNQSPYMGNHALPSPSGVKEGFPGETTAQRARRLQKPNMGMGAGPGPGPISASSIRMGYGSITAEYGGPASKSANTASNPIFSVPAFTRQPMVAGGAGRVPPVRPQPSRGYYPEPSGGMIGASASSYLDHPVPGEASNWSSGSGGVSGLSTSSGMSNLISSGDEFMGRRSTSTAPGYPPEVGWPGPSEGGGPSRMARLDHPSHSGGDFPDLMGEPSDQRHQANPVKAAKQQPYPAPARPLVPDGPSAQGATPGPEIGPGSGPRPASASAPTSTPAPKKPTPGPKTFDAMGIPAVKQQDECIVM